MSMTFEKFVEAFKLFILTFNFILMRLKAFVVFHRLIRFPCVNVTLIKTSDHALTPCKYSSAAQLNKNVSFCLQVEWQSHFMNKVSNEERQRISCLNCDEVSV